jgi:DNA-binding transcriptional LysR family regulator
MVDVGSQSKAARELGVTPAMVGRMLRMLEDRLGVRLINRTTRAQSLTESGAIFYGRAVNILTLLQDAERTASLGQLEPTGTLKLSAPIDFGRQYLAPAIADFCKLNAHLNVHISLNDRVVDLVDEGFDVAVRIGNLQNSGMIARKIALSREIVCASKDYLRVHGRPLLPSDLKTHNCLTYTYTAHPNQWRFSKGGKDQSVNVSGTLNSNNGASLVSAASAGLGIIKQPTFNAAEAIRRGDLVTLFNDYTIQGLTVYAVYPPGRPVPLKTKRFIDFLAKRFSGTPIWDDNTGSTSQVC